MKIQEVAEALERFAPLPLQEGYDNAGLQVGLTAAEASGVLLCLDVTPEVIREAVAMDCNMVVSHHPLLFRGLKRIADDTLVERCVREAILRGVALYAAHTNLDNALGGVNYRIAEMLGLGDVEFLEPASDGQSGSGIIGTLPKAEGALDFLARVKKIFHVDCLMHNAGPHALVQRIAVCGGAGDFLADRAVAEGADVFLTGEIGYHHFFGYEDKIWLAALGHYQSEQFTIDLMGDILREQFPNLHIEQTRVNTNPILYMV